MRTQIKHLSLWRTIRVVTNKRTITFDLDDHGRLKKKMRRQNTRILSEEMAKLSIDPSKSIDDTVSDVKSIEQPPQNQVTNNLIDQQNLANSKQSNSPPIPNQAEPIYFLNDFIINETSYSLDSSDEFDLDEIDSNFVDFDFSNLQI